MAKLSARGRHELVRLSKTITVKEWRDYSTYDIETGVSTVHNPPLARSFPKPSDVVQERHTYTLMSDTHILFKMDCLWHNGQKHTYNWTDKGKSKLTLEQFTDRLKAKGYEVSK